MNARINGIGTLYVERATEKFRAQYCPFRLRGDAMCGDGCPLFFETGETERYVMLGCSSRQDIEYTIVKDERNYDK